MNAPNSCGCGGRDNVSGIRSLLCLDIGSDIFLVNMVHGLILTEAFNIVDEIGHNFQ